MSELSNKFVDGLNRPVELISAGIGIGMALFVAVAGTIESIFEEAEQSIDNVSVSVSVDDLDPDLVRQVNKYFRLR